MRPSTGGTQKKILGEPTMMPNWDRDAEVWHLHGSLLSTFACHFLPAHWLSRAGTESLTRGAITGHDKTLRPLRQRTRLLLYWKPVDGCPQM